MTKLCMLFCLTAMCISLTKCGLLYRPKRSEIESAVDGDNSQAGDVEVQIEGPTSGDLPFCFETEPCRFVFVKKNPKDLRPLKKTIPSWCQCNVSEVCVQIIYDRRRKMEVFRCQTLEQQQQRQQLETSSNRRRRHHHHHGDQSQASSWSQFLHLTPRSQSRDINS